MAKRQAAMPMALDDADDAGDPVRGRVAVVAPPAPPRQREEEAPNRILTEAEIRERALSRLRRNRPEGLVNGGSVPDEKTKPLTEAEIREREWKRREAARDAKLEQQTRPSSERNRFRVVLDNPTYFAAPIEFSAEDVADGEEALALIRKILCESVFLAE